MRLGPLRPVGRTAARAWMPAGMAACLQMFLDFPAGFPSLVAFPGTASGRLPVTLDVS